MHYLLSVSQKLMEQQQTENWKKNIQFSLELQKNEASQVPGQLSILTVGLGILDVYSQSNSSKTKWIQRLSNPTNAFRKNFRLCY